MLCLISTVRVDKHSFQSFIFEEKWSQFTFPFLIFVFIAFSVSYIEFVGNTFTKTLQNLCCQTEMTFIVESFSIGKIWNFQQIHVKSLDCQIILYSSCHLSHDNQTPPQRIFLPLFLLIYDAVYEQKTIRKNILEIYKQLNDLQITVSLKSRHNNFSIQKN